MEPHQWTDELKRYQDEIYAGTRRVPVRTPITPATLERSLHFARFVLDHPDMQPIIERRFIVQEDLKEDRQALRDMMWFYQLKYDLDNLNVTGLVLVWGVLADILSGKYSGLEDPELTADLERDIELHANSAFREKAK